MTYLTETITNKLEQYQITQIERLIADYLNTNKTAKQFVYLSCPTCNHSNPVLTKGGFTSKGKQMLRCTHCRKRFVLDIGQLTFYSHQPQSAWDAFALETWNGRSLASTAALLDVHESTAFRMRHKLLNSLSMQTEEYVLSNLIEVDEIYLLENRKGQKVMDRTSRKRGSPATKRGLSNEQVCLITAIERDGESYLHSYNFAKPGFTDIKQLAQHIKAKSYVLVDGLASYNVLGQEHECTINVLKTYESYDKVNHLNNVNSLHARIRSLYESYRGIATRYINRYAALFSFQYKYRGMDNNEKLLLL